MYLQSITRVQTTIHLKATTTVIRITAIRILRCNNTVKCRPTIKMIRPRVTIIITTTTAAVTIIHTQAAHKPMCTHRPTIIVHRMQIR